MTAASRLEHRVPVHDGKYTIIYGGGPRPTLRVLRYGKEWRDLTGDNLILALAQEVEELRAQVDTLRAMALRAHDERYAPDPLDSDDPSIHGKGYRS